MNRYYAVVRFLVAVCFAVLLRGQYVAGADASSAIKVVLTTQADAWNRGDLGSFMNSYTDNCTFMGTPVMQGRAQVLARYRRVYPTGAAMGKLTFNSLEIRLLDHHFAIATGNWHLDRDATNGGNVGGYFSLVLAHRHSQWRILLDHTSSVRAATPQP